MSVRVVLLAPALMALSTLCAAEPGRPSLAQACAAFDRYVLTFLEEDGRAVIATGPSLATAMADLIDARAACHRGDYALALDRYSRIDLGERPRTVVDIAKAR